SSFTAATGARSAGVRSSRAGATEQRWSVGIGGCTARRAGHGPALARRASVSSFARLTTSDTRRTKTVSITAILPDIRQASRRVAREWADVVTTDDLEQDIVTTLLSAGDADTVAGMSEHARSSILSPTATTPAN